jgi:hypothetical protein
VVKPVEAPTKEVVERLAAFLDAKIPSLAQVLSDFPEANTVLKYPAISISHGPATFTYAIPTVYAQGVPASNAADVKYDVGWFDWSLQIDLWERTKEQRYDLFEEFFSAFHDAVPSTGINLTLTQYHNVICNYFMQSHAFEDGEVSSQRKEWRARINVAAMSRTVLTKREYIITQPPETQLEIYVETPIIP